MKALLLTIATAVATSIAAPGFAGADPAQEPMKIIVLGAVLGPGIIEIPVGTSLEKILNTAVCYETSSTKRIIVYRSVDKVVTKFMVTNSKEAGGNLEVFELKSGDFVNVPCRMFAEDTEKKPVLVEGPFFIREVQEQAE
jgi:protein involved in polysaccharide export with SLBB domain